MTNIRFYVLIESKINLRNARLKFLLQKPLDYLVKFSIKTSHREPLLFWGCRSVCHKISRFMLIRFRLQTSINKGENRDEQMTHGSKVYCLR